jgi:hypothetical protein
MRLILEDPRLQSRLCRYRREARKSLSVLCGALICAELSSVFPWIQKIEDRKKTNRAAGWTCF